MPLPTLTRIILSSADLRFACYSGHHLGLTSFIPSVKNRASIKSNSDTYSRLIRRFFGTTGSNLLKLMMILNCGGILIVYLVMIMDILVGTERDGFMGVIPSLSGVHEAGHLATSRNGILAITLVLILGPVACLRCASADPTNNVIPRG